MFFVPKIQLLIEIERFYFYFMIVLALNFIFLFLSLKNLKLWNLKTTIIAFLKMQPIMA